jgi:hypothetical protein
LEVNGVHADWATRFIDSKGEIDLCLFSDALRQLEAQHQ